MRLPLFRAHSLLWRRCYFQCFQVLLQICWFTRFVFNIPGCTSPGRFRNVILGRSLQNHFKYRICIFIFQAAHVQRTWLSLRLTAFFQFYTLQELASCWESVGAYNGSFFVRRISIWNSLPISIRTASAEVEGFRLL